MADVGAASLAATMSAVVTGGGSRIAPTLTGTIADIDALLAASKVTFATA